jgi:hypothetical protein
MRRMNADLIRKYPWHPWQSVCPNLLWFEIGTRSSTIKKTSKCNLLAEAARTPQNSLFTCLVDFRERENRSRKVIDAG